MADKSELRELLRLAAAAAGIPIEWSHECECPLRLDRVGTVPWNPLTDDGDALRLAVRLHLFVIVEGDQDDDAKRRTQAGHRGIGSKSQLHGADPEAATRRAIVRAAAAMAAAPAFGAA